MGEFEPSRRAIRLIEDAISKFELNLQNLVVLTEAASRNYIFTPLIAALAGARKVHAVTKNSRYATAKQVIKSTCLVADYWGVADRLEIHTTLTPSIIGEADVVTNLGFVRPINKEFISHMKKTAVIPLMFETWEFREEDLDLQECRRKGICVLGTNEVDERLKTFGYIGHLIIKRLFEIEIEVFRSRIAVIGSGKFSLNITNTLGAIGAHVVNIFGEKAHSSRRASPLHGILKGCDAIIVAHHLSPALVVGSNGQVSPSELKELCPDVVVIQLSGRIDRNGLDRYEIRYLPYDEPDEGHMSWSLSELGPRPVIDLHTAGLKVGELMVRARLRGLGRDEAEREALRNPICQNFSAEQESIHGR
jgi:hypothetical protein